MAEERVSRVERLQTRFLPDPNGAQGDPRSRALTRFVGPSHAKSVGGCIEVGHAGGAQKIPGVDVSSGECLIGGDPFRHPGASRGDVAVVQAGLLETVGGAGHSQLQSQRPGEVHVQIRGGRVGPSLALPGEDRGITRLVSRDIEGIAAVAEVIAQGERGPSRQIVASAEVEPVVERAPFAMLPVACVEGTVGHRTIGALGAPGSQKVQPQVRKVVAFVRIVGRIEIHVRSGAGAESHDEIRVPARARAGAFAGLGAGLFSRGPEGKDRSRQASHLERAQGVATQRRDHQGTTTVSPDSRTRFCSGFFPERIFS